MPVYEYRCDHCGNAFSAVRSYTDEPLAACPSCGQPPRKIVSRPAIVFKGSGWYKTDSRAAPGHEGATAQEKAEKSDKPDKPGKAEKAGKPADQKDAGAPKTGGPNTSTKGTAAS